MSIEFITGKTNNFFIRLLKTVNYQNYLNFLLHVSKNVILLLANTN